MEHIGSIKSGIHYHIRWSDLSLDWKPFPPKEEATGLASLIKLHNDSFNIVERDHQCERCKVFESKLQKDQDC